MSTASDERTRLVRACDLATPWALRTAATLGIADRLAAGPAGAAQLARACGADPAALAALLRYLVTVDVLEPAPGDTFTLAEAGHFLRRDHPRSLAPLLDLNGASGRLDGAWAGLPAAVTGGGSGYRALYGRDFWEDLEADPALARSFADHMAGWGEIWVPEVVAATDWGAYGRVMDVGGGSGMLVAALAEAFPTLTLALVDRRTEAAAELRGRRGLEGRVEVWPASFFDPLPCGAPVAVLAQVVHDWPDAEATAIITRCAEAVGPDGRVVLIERVRAAEGVDPRDGLMDLFMRVCFGSGERTAAEFAALAAPAGLRPERTLPLPCGLSLIELTRG